MALNTQGKLLPLPQQALDTFNDTDIAHLMLPEISHAFYRLYTGDWTYVKHANKVLMLNAAQQPPVTRRQVDAAWYRFVTKAFADWELFEQSRLVYRIPAGVRIVGRWEDGYKAKKFALRLMASPQAEQFWEERWRRLGKPEGYDSTPVSFDVPIQHTREIARREAKKRDKFYRRIREYLFIEDQDAAGLEEEDVELPLLGEDGFDEFNLGVSEIVTGNEIKRTWKERGKKRSEVRKETKRRKRLREREAREAEVVAEGVVEAAESYGEGGVAVERYVAGNMVGADVAEAKSGGKSGLLNLPIRRKRKADDGDDGDEDKENGAQQGRRYTMELQLRGKRQRGADM